MIMDSQLSSFLNSVNGFEFENGLIFSDPNVEISNGFTLSDQSLGFGFSNDPYIPSLGFNNSSNSASSSTMDKEGDSYSPSDDSDFSDTVLKYISQVLMEEDMADKPFMFHDSLALQAAERSLYEVLGEKYPSPSPTPLFGDLRAESPDNCSSGAFSDHGSNGSSSCSAGNSIDPQWNADSWENNSKPSLLQTPIPANFVFQSSKNHGLRSSAGLQNGSANSGNEVVDSKVSELMIPNYFSESELMLQFKRGVEEASKFLPKGSQLLIDLETSVSAPEVKEKTPMAIVVKTEDEEREYSPIRLTGKKNHEREDEDLEDGRNNKQSAVYVDESELSELFDKVLLCNLKEPPVCILEATSQNNGPIKTQQKEQNNRSSTVAKTRGKKQGTKKDVVDLRTLLVSCVQAVSSNDFKTANELLKQIRQHSSRFGDGSQRLAHFFADALEARIAGSGTQIYSTLSSKRRSVADMLKAYQVYISACPFLKFAMIFANHNILQLAMNATTLHIIDFGIFYGFQWPGLIQRLSRRPGGPPKLHITGIEFPQRGFRPAEAVQETGHRLAKYCERFNVPFEFNAIAQKWETIRIEDLKIKPDEVLAVNCVWRLKNLLDETVVVNSPRDSVLNLIRKINPDIFIQSIVNGSYNAPFFVTRFREALFHYSALFDIFDANIPPEDQMRLMFEKEFYGREIMNVVACEGTERVERPETYKQWQVRNMRAGFRQLALDPLLMKKLTNRAKELYHNDFMVNEDGQWMLQGWKGRIVYASSVWVPA